MNDKPDTCAARLQPSGKRCGKPATHTLPNGRTRVCDLHKRLRQMRSQARYRGRAVPSRALLERLFAEQFPTCTACGRQMVLTVTRYEKGDRRGRVVTLQHDRGGGLRLLCNSCNVRHAGNGGDSFYLIPPGCRRCRRCGRVGPQAEFVKGANTCRACSRPPKPKPPPETERTCKACDQVQPLEAFAAHPSGRWRLHTCRACYLEAERVRNRKRKRNRTDRPQAQPKRCRTCRRRMPGRAYLGEGRGRPCNDCAQCRGVVHTAPLPGDLRACGWCWRVLPLAAFPRPEHEQPRGDRCRRCVRKAAEASQEAQQCKSA